MEMDESTSDEHLKFINAVEVLIVDDIEGEVLIDGRDIEREELEEADSVQEKESEDELIGGSTSTPAKKNIPEKRRRRRKDSEEDAPYRERHYVAKNKSNQKKTSPRYMISKQTVFTCTICQAEFTQNGNLKRHMMTHTGEKPFKCDICNASFNQKVNLNKHLKTHIEELPFHVVYEDEITGLTPSPGKQNIGKKRRKRDTDDETPFEEHYGTKREYHRKNGGRSSQQNISAKQSFSCTICKAEFTQNGNLKRHMMTHTGEKPFKCDICNATFNQKVNLNKHLKRHDKEEPFRCDTCEVTFSDELNLNTHLKRHSDDTPYYLVYVGK